MSLIVFYTTVIVVFLSIIGLVIACTTTHPAEKPSTTDHLPTGKTQPTSPQHHPMLEVSREWLTGLQDFEREYRRTNELKSPYKID
jgi:hypothetical protein